MRGREAERGEGRVREIFYVRSAEGKRTDERKARRTQR